jgi:ArsR family transcriptional regulator
MESVIEAKATLSKLKSPVTMYPQVTINIRVTDKSVIKDERVVKKADEARALLGDGGRILLRESGTEPVVRVMVEAEREELCRLAECFKLFGDPTRLRILFALSASELCVCDLADVLALTKSAVSHQLKALRRDNFVAYRRAGKNVFYRLSDSHVGTILATTRVHINEPQP